MVAGGRSLITSRFPIVRVVEPLRDEFKDLVLASGELI